MSLTINTNIEALDAQRNLSNTENALSTSMERLSSGMKINSAADDVAGYAISERLQSQINGINQAEQNSQDAVSLAQTAQGSLNEVEQMLQRVRELAVQYANGTNSTSDKEAIGGEVEQLNSEIARVGETTKFNGIALLSGSRLDHVPGRRQRNQRQSRRNHFGENVRIGQNGRYDQPWRSQRHRKDRNGDRCCLEGRG